jgi:2-hydroxy-3-keto-5-methylthiopentenyl-1-phosphate phosphatase
MKGYRLAHSLLPRPQAAQVWLDFDGTISQKDVLDELIEHYAVNESWKLIEQRWQTGLIGSRECLEQEFTLLRITDRQLNAFLDRITLDPGIGPLLELLGEYRVPVAILSDGIDFFIERILARHGFTGLTIRSNTLERHNHGLRLACPHAAATCESAAAHCKCTSAAGLRAPGRRTIYVGDGRSDLCPARKADAVFAKAVLARTLAAEHVPYIPYTTLGDVAATLSEMWQRKTAAG